MVIRLVAADSVTGSKSIQEKRIEPKICNVIPADAHGLSISEQTVVYMTLPLLNKGHTIYMDNWYSSVRLYLYLLKKKTLACGTVRIARGLPQKIVTSQPPENSSSVSLIGDEITNATKYLSTKVVYMLSTCHGHEELAVPNRRRDGNKDLN